MLERWGAEEQHKVPVGWKVCFHAKSCIQRKFFAAFEEFVYKVSGKTCWHELRGTRGPSWIGISVCGSKTMRVT